VSVQEAEYIRAGIPGIVSASPLRWRQIIGDRNVILLTISYFCYGYAAYIFFTWFFNYLNSTRGLALGASARFAMLPGLGMAIGSAAGGWINDRLTTRFGRYVGRCGVASGAIGLAALFIAVGPTVDSPRLASVILAGGAGVLYLAQSSFWSVSADIAGPSAGAVSGIMNMGAQIGGFVTAWMTPLIGEHFGWSRSFFAAAGLCVIGAIAWTAVRPDREIAAARPETATV
jgi:ACS family glucarate transporter-like MFS transporter